MQVISTKFLKGQYDGCMRAGRPCEPRRSAFGSRLYKAREALGLSQAEVASRLGVNQASYGAWERQPVALRPEQIEKLSKVLKIPVEELFGGQNAVKRNGPVGKAQRLFEKVSQLPRSQQLHVLAVVEAFVEKKIAS